MSVTAIRLKRNAPWRELLGWFIRQCGLTVRKAYHSAWKEFESVTGVSLAEAEELEVLKFIAWCLEQTGRRSDYNPTDTRVSQITVKQKLVRLSTLATEIERHNPTYRNHFKSHLQSFKRVKAGRKKVRIALSGADVERLRDSQGQGREGVRNRAIISLAFGAGLRIGEVLNLAVGDILQDVNCNKFLQLRSTKAGEPQQQPLHAWELPAVEALISQRLAEGASPTDPLITCYEKLSGKSYGTWVKYWTFRKWWVQWLKDAKLAANLTSHTGRRTAITTLLAQGSDPRVVQEFSRHSSISMVERYDLRRTDPAKLPAPIYGKLK